MVTAPLLVGMDGLSFEVALADQPLLLEPLLDEAGDLQVVPVQHQHVRVAAGDGVRKIDDLDLAFCAEEVPQRRVMRRAASSHAGTQEQSPRRWATPACAARDEP